MWIDRQAVMVMGDIVEGYTNLLQSADLRCRPEEELD